MLRRISRQRPRREGGHFAIIASRYNARYVDSMLAAAEATLRAAKADVIEVVRVPGAYEIPVVAARLARICWPAWSGIICLGVVIRGETSHAQLIAEAVTNALMDIQVAREIPIIHEVLLLENKSQAEVRCLGADHNRGREAAQTALEMAQIMTSLRNARSRE